MLCVWSKIMSAHMHWLMIGISVTCDFYFNTTCVKMHSTSYLSETAKLKKNKMTVILLITVYLSIYNTSVISDKTFIIWGIKNNVHWFRSATHLFMARSLPTFRAVCCSIYKSTKFANRFWTFIFTKWAV